MSDDASKRASSVKTHGVIDRIEDNGMAVVLVGENEETTLDLPLSMLPLGARDGDHLTVKITTDSASRARAERRVKALQKRLEKQSGAVDIKHYKL